MARIILAIVLILMLTACNGGYISLAISTPFVWPSPLPTILSPTPPFIPTATPAIITPISPTLTPTSVIPSTVTIPLTNTSTPTATNIITPSHTSTYTFTPTPSSTQTFTSTQLPPLSLDILGCNTGLDILHQMGEVTNAYPVVRNTTGQNLTNVCATLSASDEARVHPDKTACVASLPAGYQVTLKLTVDTGTGEDTSIQVVVSTNEGFGAIASRPSCQEVGMADWLIVHVGVVEPIQ